MDFTSLSYFAFLGIVFFLYWLVPDKFRNIVIVVFSYVFYYFINFKYVLFLIALTCISYYLAMSIGKCSNNHNKKILLFISVSSILLTLFILKYFNFTISIISSIVSNDSKSVDSQVLNLILPVGISFYSFEIIGYLVDVYYGKTIAEANFINYAAFIAFFPQLLAGPIARSQRLLPQIKNQKKFLYANGIDGIKRIELGLFEKICVAGNIAPIIDTVYGQVNEYRGFTLMLLTFLYSIQIYCDFSGYSDIAIGSAKLLGVDLAENFKHPYFAASIKDFWRRWHISLTQWLRDYVYIPMGGNRCKKTRYYFNVICTFIISGIWHGAGFNYLIWGCLHGVAMVIENIFTDRKKINIGHRKFIVLNRLLVFVFCSIAWIFFRAGTITDSIYVLTHMFTGINNPWIYLYNGIHDCNIILGGLENFVRMFMLIGLMFIIDYLKEFKLHFIDRVNNKPRLEWVIYFIFTFVILICAPDNQTGQFIYFQF